MLALPRIIFFFDCIFIFFLSLALVALPQPPGLRRGSFGGPGPPSRRYGVRPRPVSPRKKTALRVAPSRSCFCFSCSWQTASLFLFQNVVADNEVVCVSVARGRQRGRLKTSWQTRVPHVLRVALFQSLDICVFFVFWMVFESCAIETMPR